MLVLFPIFSQALIQKVKKEKKDFDDMEKKVSMLEKKIEVIEKKIK